MRRATNGAESKSASNFSSSQALIPPALATGRLTIISNAMAREIALGKDGKADAVSYIDRTTKEERRCVPGALESRRARASPRVCC